MSNLSKICQQTLNTIMIICMLQSNMLENCITSSLHSESPWMVTYAHWLPVIWKISSWMHSIIRTSFQVWAQTALQDLLHMMLSEISLSIYILLVGGQVKAGLIFYDGLLWCRIKFHALQVISFVSFGEYGNMWLRNGFSILMTCCQY